MRKPSFYERPPFILLADRYTSIALPSHNVIRSAIRPKLGDAAWAITSPA